MKKHYICILVLVAMVTMLTGCGNKQENKYNEAVELFNNKQYAEALEIFEEVALKEGHEEYAEDLNWYRLAAYVGSNDKIEYFDTENEYTVTLKLDSDNMIYATYGVKEIEGFGLDMKVNIPKVGEAVKLEAEALVVISPAYMEEEAYAIWDVANYKAGDIIEWDEYKVSGVNANGEAFEEDDEGLLTYNETIVERFVNGISKTIESSKLDITIQDFGFTSYE